MNPLNLKISLRLQGFPGGLAGKEATCNARDPSLTPGSGRSPGEGIGYTLQYSWASLVAQLVKNLLAMQLQWILSLGWEDPLEVEMATHSSILAWRIPKDRGAWRAAVHGVAKSRTRLSLDPNYAQKLTKGLKEEEENGTVLLSLLSVTALVSF